MIRNGVDIIKWDRFNNICEDSKIIKKFLTNAEQLYIKSKAYNPETIAGIYASKEAVLKSLGYGINHYNLKDIEIMHDEYNCPYIKFYNDIKKEIETNRYHFSLSISHDGEYVIAFVIYYQD